MSINFFEEKFAGIDINDTATVTVAIDVSEFRTVVYQSEIATGVMGASVLKLQGSCDGTNLWVDIPLGEVTGEDISRGIEVSVRYVRVKVKTASGSAATADIIVQLKK